MQYDSDIRVLFHEGLAKISRKLRKTFDGRVAALGLTYPRAHLLYLLSKHGRLTQSAVACEMEIENPTVVRLLDTMEKYDLIRREPVEGDRRAKHVVLTAHGKAQAARVTEMAGELRKAVMDGIDPSELRAGLCLFERMSDNMEAMLDPKAEAEHSRTPDLRVAGSRTA